MSQITTAATPSERLPAKQLTICHEHIAYTTNSIDDTIKLLIFFTNEH